MRSDDVRAVEIAMSCDDLVLRKARRGLETVNILRKTAQQFAVVVEQFQKVMRRRRAEIPWPQLLAEPLERPRILLIEIEVEDRLRKWQTILLEIIIKPASWRSEVRDSRRNGYSSTCHDNHSGLRR